MPESLLRADGSKSYLARRAERQSCGQPRYPDLVGYVFAVRDERAQADVQPLSLSVQENSGVGFGLLSIPIAADGLPTTLDGEPSQRKKVFTFAIVPSEQPRSTSERRRSQIVATIATPFVAVADIVVDPLGVAFLYFFWRE